MFNQNLAQMKTRCLNTLVAVGRNGFDTISMSVIKSLLLTFSVALLIVSSSQAQEDKNWVFGHNAGLSFPGPTSFTGSAIDTNEGCSSISDPNGNLLFYTDGMTVWGNNNLPLLNGTGLMGNKSATQSAIIVPWPQSQCNRYLIFTVDASENQLQNGLRYSVISGGAVTLKNVPLKYPVAEKLTAVSDGYGGFWVIAHGYTILSNAVKRTGNDEFYAYHITNTVVPQEPVTSHVGSMHRGMPGMGWAAGLGTAAGALKVSPDGKRLACASFTGNFVEMFNFDTATGAVTNPQTVPIQFANKLPYGLEFSPDSTKLYLSSTGGSPNELYQYDLTSVFTHFPIFIASSNGTYDFGALQLGPDGKIYLARYYKPNLDVIQSPNNYGTACGYLSAWPLLTYPSESRLGLPTVIQGQFSCTDCAIPTPVITGNANNCILNTTYSVSVPSGCIASWTISNGTINGSSTGNSVNVTWNKTGTGSIKVTITCHGCTTTKTMQVTPCIS